MARRASILRARSGPGYFTSIEDAYFVDCGLSYDGRNTGATTITVSGGTTWTEPEQVTLTAGVHLHGAGHGRQIFFDLGNVRYRIEINGYISGTQVTGVLLKDLPGSIGMLRGQTGGLRGARSPISITSKGRMLWLLSMATWSRVSRSRTVGL